MKNIFPEDTINVTYKRCNSLTELISSSMFPQAQTVYYFMVSKCKFKRCNICQNYWVSKSKFTYTGTGKTYNVRSKLCCTDSNFIYLIHCKLSREKYVGSAFKNNFKPRSRIRKLML